MENATTGTIELIQIMSFIRGIREDVYFLRREIAEMKEVIVHPMHRYGGSPVLRGDWEGYRMPTAPSEPIINDRASTIKETGWDPNGN
jgi:hypothetical protein